MTEWLKWEPEPECAAVFEPWEPAPESVAAVLAALQLPEPGPVLVQTLAPGSHQLQLVPGTWWPELAPEPLKLELGPGLVPAAPEQLRSEPAPESGVRGPRGSVLASAPVAPELLN